MTSAVVHRAPALLDHQLVKRVGGRPEHAAGVSQLKRDLFGKDRIREHIPGGAGEGRDDSAACPGEAIEEGGFPDVGSADEHHGGKAGDRHG